MTIDNNIISKIRFNWVPSINNETGKATFIVKNAIKCKKCGDVIESKFQHDFKQCSCGSCFVDGGHAYIRRGGYEDQFENLTEHITLSKEEYEEWCKLRDKFYSALNSYPVLPDDIPKEWVEYITAQKEYEYKCYTAIFDELNNKK